MSNAPSIEQLVAATNGTVSRDGESVIVSYGRDGYLRVTPSTVWDADGNDVPAAFVNGRVSSRNGGRHAEVRSALRAAGIEAR